MKPPERSCLQTRTSRYARKEPPRLRLRAARLVRTNRGRSPNSLNTPGKPSRRPRGTRRFARGQRRGVALVEFAVVASVLFLLVVGMFEFGRMVMVQQFLTNASRAGARRGILEHTTESDVQTIVTDYLSSSAISGATVTVSPDQLSTVGFGDPVSVTVSVPFDHVSWLPASRFLGGKNLSAQSVMIAERPE